MTTVKYVYVLLVIAIGSLSETILTPEGSGSHVCGYQEQKCSRSAVTTPKWHNRARTVGRCPMMAGWSFTWRAVRASSSRSERLRVDDGQADGQRRHRGGIARQRHLVLRRTGTGARGTSH